jgi:hypothetical protein
VLVSDSLNNTSSHAEHLLQQSKVLWHHNFNWDLYLKCSWKVDAAFEEEGGVVATSHSTGRTVYAPTGALNKDFSDVRSYGEAAEKGVKRW